MASFLKKLASQIIENKDFDLVETAIILPSKRAGRLLQKELAKQIGKPFFSPGIFAINDYIEALSPQKKVSRDELLLILYDVYRNISNGKEKPLQSFLSWGATFLHDLNDIDMQLVEPRDVFQNLQDIKQLESSFKKEELSGNQQQYLSFYTSLQKLHAAFVKNLEENNWGYEGLIYKDVALNIETYAKKSPYKRYVFAGLNALSPSEYKILHYYHQNCKAEYYFDFDEFYMDAIQLITRQHKNKLLIREWNWVHQDYKTIPKKITQAGMPGVSAQITYAIEQIKRLKEEEGTLDNTVLVLADESLLLPFLHAYDVSPVNLTMGYPLAATPAYHLLQIIIELAKNGFRFKEIQKSPDPIYYYKDVLALFRNPIIKDIFFQNDENESLIEEITGTNKIFLTSRDIPACAEKVFPETPVDVSLFLNKLNDYFRYILHLAPANFRHDQNITLLLQGLDELQEMLAGFKTGIPIDFTVLEYLIKERIANISIPLKGDPENGLQVMGLLETRALDFKNVIMLSVNEGTLPAGMKQNSLVLYDVRHFFKLPGYQQKDAVYAYHFFRLLQRAEKIYLAYDNESGDTLKEKSRFINQLEFEIKERNLEENITFESDRVKLLPQQEDPKKRGISIPKTAELVQLLKKKSYSPSSISEYIQCPLKFYLHAIEKIEPAKTVSENIEQKVIGSIMHEILESIFGEIVLNPENHDAIIDKASREIEETIFEHFAKNENCKGQDQRKGKLYLATEIAKRSLVSYLEFAKIDFMQQPYKVLGIEMVLTAEIDINEEPVKLFGKADRVDEKGDTIRILDYKTGWVKEADLKCEAMDELFQNPDKSKLLQLFMYGYMYTKNRELHHQTGMKKVEGKILSFRELNKNSRKGILSPMYEKRGIEMEDYELFGDELKKILQQILNPEKPFVQTEDADQCKYCDYALLCGRVQ